MRRIDFEKAHIKGNFCICIAELGVLRICPGATSRTSFAAC
jgi:hypothetical protein